MLRLTDQLQKIEKAAKQFQDGEKELHKQLEKFHADLEREYVFFFIPPFTLSGELSS